MGLFGSKENSENLMYQAMSLMENNKAKAAVSLFNKVLKKDPKNIQALYNKGLALIGPNKKIGVLRIDAVRNKIL